MKRTFSKSYLSVVLALLLLFITAGGAGAITYDITAETGNLTMPDGTLIPIWGYSLTDSTGAATGAPSVPGPVIEVPPGDSLTINLYNYLDEATSLHILGQKISNNTGPVFPADGRVLSFTHQAAANGGSAIYIWDTINPGTYMLQSATHPARQVQMGLFAAVKADFAANQAYDGMAYDDERILVFHEIDPDFHLSPLTTTIVLRHPRYYLINGAAFPDTDLADVAAGQTVLLRFVNAGLETHVPQILNQYLTLVAQDGIRRSYDQEVYGFELNSAGTMDAILQVDPADEGATFPIYDARVKHLTNAGDTFGGMLVHLSVGAGTPADTVTILRTRYNAGQSQLRVWATTNDPNATLTVIDPAAGAVTNLDFTDVNVLNGEFTRMFVASVAANPGATTVTSTGGGSATATTVPFTSAPEAFDDASAADQGQAQIIAVLTNDLKGGYLLNANALRPVVQTAPANGTAVANADGTITYTPNAGFSGPDSFTYAAQAYNTNNGNTLATSASATVSVFVNPSNAAPTAADDAYNGTEGATANVPAPGVLGNDSDPEGSAITAVLDSGPTAGTLALNSDGSFTFDGPAGSHTFTYVANDGALDSAPAIVTISINDLPAAADDAYNTDENVDLVVVAANGVLDNDSDANPAGGALTATLVNSTVQGILTFTSDGSFTYEPGFNFSGPDTFTYTVTDELGAVSDPATATITVNNTTDTVTITRLRWRNNQTRARIIATSNAPGGSVVLTAFANFNDGNPAQELGTLRYRAQNGDYRATLPFDTTRGLPATITVTSSQGGSDTRAIPTN